MTEVDVTICNRLGLHARAAARFVQLANQFESRIEVVSEQSKADGKSILGLLTLAASRGSSIHLSANGPDEKAAIEELVELIEGRFGEDE